MKAYSQLATATNAARRHVKNNGGGAAVIETSDLPGMYQVGTLFEARRIAQTQNVLTCRLTYGATLVETALLNRQNKPCECCATPVAPGNDWGGSERWLCMDCATYQRGQSTEQTDDL